MCVYLYVYAWVTASYTVPQPTYALSKTVPVRHVRPWNGVYTARDSPGQPHMIVVIDTQLLKVERGHRATRWCNMIGIQRIYDMFTCPRLSCPTLECRIYSTGQSSTAMFDRCGTPKAAEVQEGHRATRQCDITYIQRIYDTYKYHGTHIGHFGRFSIFYSPVRSTAPYIRSMPI